MEEPPAGKHPPLKTRLTPLPASCYHALRRGGMAERPKAVVLKTTERKLRGFESLSLRQTNALARPRAMGYNAPPRGEMAEWLKALAC